MRFAAALFAICALLLGGAAATGATGRRGAHRVCHATAGHHARGHGRCPAQGASRRHTDKHRPRARRHPASTPTASGRGGASSGPGAAGASSGSPNAASAPPPAISAAEGGLAPGLESPSGAPPAPARAQITAKEFSLTLSRPEVPSGKVILEFVDGGQDEHNLHIRPSAGGPDVGAFPTTLPGRHLDVTFSLAPGTYTLYCSIPAHEELGMKASFTVG